ncbi:hypothetical protein YH65_07580 [Sulfurovum lithotrophicum]|uniref:Outer membrane protein beta-barrel domain-containing protein n=1 Tax=Sulfurovum lithotrophicum TaxID=206403 RepID=A0A7U4RR09_9BACT|nr:outer membrane beta-barrel protein [Sulfurovum lithotrophicum]AKF25266.1 hypothetical protein YH65_07580 [Sulfurovum lithotrophicum]
MKKFSLSLATILAMSTFSMAGGDIAPVEPVVEVVDTWSGPYAGIQAGGVFGDADVSIPAYPSNFSLDPSGFAGGLYMGYNWLLEDNLLLGVEGVYNWMSADDDGLSGGSGGERYKVEQNWDAALLLRAGKVMGDMMPYITGGVAWTELETTYIPDNWGGRTDTVTGWTIGAGIEKKINENLHARIQYRYTNYNTADFFHAGPSHVDYDSSNLMLGVSYRF